MVLIFLLVIYLISIKNFLQILYVVIGIFQTLPTQPIPTQEQQLLLQHHLGIEIVANGKEMMRFLFLKTEIGDLLISRYYDMQMYY